MKNLEKYFGKFRKNTIGYNQEFISPYGKKKIVYADWIASGRLYEPIENWLKDEIAPFVGNTHTETSVTGTIMTMAYQKALNIVKEHVGGKKSDVIISSNSGMTGVINKFQRILGLKLHEKFRDCTNIPEDMKPIVLVSHMEHHSNQTTWIETIADWDVIGADSEGLVDLGHLEVLLEKYKSRKLKIAAVTSCSNVTGIFTPYHEIAEIMHKHGGLCFVDFAASAPYIDINMHPENPEQRLDALYFSPHKFLGGPGSSGILVFDSKLYDNKIPDQPGGGTVKWTNPWGGHSYIDDIETREDGGTPAFLQTMKVALAIKLKEEMGVENLLQREREILDILWTKLSKIKNLHILADNIKNRLGVFSFYIDGLHYNLAVKLLNDRFGIQTRGGCSCAGTYGHYLLHVTEEQSRNITKEIDRGDLSDKPGWIRLSIHPTMTDKEIFYICDAIKKVSKKYKKWEKDYLYIPNKNEYEHKKGYAFEKEKVENWFENNLK
ncbi:aminotransferase class V-fold PLP-dependent enzyme [Bacteroidota bacterium]